MGLSVVVLFVLALVIKRLAENDRLFTFIEGEQIGFRVAGRKGEPQSDGKKASEDEDESLAKPIALLENVDGYYEEKREGWFNVDTHEFVPLKESGPNGPEDGDWVRVKNAIVKGDDPTDGNPILLVRNLFRRHLNLFWLGIMNLVDEWHHLHEFEIIEARRRQSIEPGADVRDLKHWLISEEKTVRSLRFQVERPIKLERVEFRDQLQANLGVVIVVQFVMPMIPAFRFPRRFFGLIESAAGATIIDYCRRQETLYEFIGNREGYGPRSPFFRNVIRITNLQTIDPNTGQRFKGVVELYGMLIVHGWVDFVEAADQDTREALRQKEIEKLKADGVRERARGEHDAIKLIGDARAETLGKLVQEAGVAVAIASERRGTIEALQNTSVTTFVEGGARVPTSLLLQGPTGSPTTPPVKPGSSPPGEQPPTPSTSPPQGGEAGTPDGGQSTSSYSPQGSGGKRKKRRKNRP